LLSVLGRDSLPLNEEMWVLALQMPPLINKALGVFRTA
jgi:hypothetical protein